MTRLRPVRDDGGFTLVEMLVALLVLSILMAGVAMTSINSLRISRSNADRGVAANLVASEMDRLRSLEFADLVDLAVPAASVSPSLSAIEQVGAVSYTIETRVYWAPNSADLGPCAGEASEADANVLRVDVTGDWPGRRTELVRSETTVAPPIGIYDPNTGTLAVFVQDHQLPPEPVPNVSVQARLIDGGPIHTGNTNANGCAIFDDLGSGDYRVSVERFQHIDIDQKVHPEVTGVQGVRPGSRSNIQFMYAPQGLLQVTAEGWSGGDLPVTDLPWHFVNTRGNYAGGDASGTTRSVFPGVYQLYAGHCPDADPEGIEGDPGDEDADLEPYWPEATRGVAVTVDPSAVATPATATIASVRIDWTPTSLTGLDLTLTATHAGDCDAGTLDLGAITSGSDRDLALPWGTWRFTARSGGFVVAESDAVALSPLDQMGARPVVTLDLVPPPVCVAPQVVGATSASTGSTSNSANLTISRPAGTQIGDLLVVEGTGTNIGNWTMQRAGWTRHHLDTTGPGAVMWSRVAGNQQLSDSGIQVNLGGSGTNRRATLTLTVLRGFDSAGVGTVASAGGNANAGVSFASRTVDVPSVWFRGVAINPTRTITSSPPPVVQGTWTVTGGSGGSRRLASWSEVVPVGPTGGRTITWNQNATNWRAYTFMVEGVCS